MSFHASTIGRDRNAVKARLATVLQNTPGGFHVHAALASLIDYYPVKPEVALKVTAQGHVDSSGYGSVNVNIEAISPLMFADWPVPEPPKADAPVAASNGSDVSAAAGQSS